jgi:hypothetical protein
MDDLTKSKPDKDILPDRIDEIHALWKDLLSDAIIYLKRKDHNSFLSVAFKILRSETDQAPRLLRQIASIYEEKGHYKPNRGEFCS